MSYSILDLKADLTGVLHGTTLSKIQNLDGLINRAGRQLLLDIDPQETKRTVLFASAIYNMVWDYASPADLKGNRIIDIFPQVNRIPQDTWGQQYNQAFDQQKILTNYDSFTIQFNNAVKTIRINSPTIQPGTTLNEANGVSTNGIWTAVAPGTNVRVDNVNYAAGTGSIQFDLPVGVPATGGVQNTNSNSTDISAMLNQGTLFCYVYLPTASAVTSVTLKWGSSSSAYYSVTATATQSNTTFNNGWNLIAFPWLGATVVGSPNPATITYLSVGFTYDGTAQTGVHVDNIVARMGQVLNCEYYSKYLFRSTAGVFQETVLDDSDLVNLDTETYNLLFNLVTYYSCQQQQGLDSTFFDGSFFLQEYNKGIERYQAIYKSEVQKPQSTYYRRPRAGYNNYYMRRLP